MNTAKTTKKQLDFLDSIEIELSKYTPYDTIITTEEVINVMGLTETKITSEGNRYIENSIMSENGINVSFLKNRYNKLKTKNKLVNRVIMNKSDNVYSKQSIEYSKANLISNIDSTVINKREPINGETSVTIDTNLSINKILKEYSNELNGTSSIFINDLIYKYDDDYTYISNIDYETNTVEIQRIHKLKREFDKLKYIDRICIGIDYFRNICESAKYTNISDLYYNLFRLHDVESNIIQIGEDEWKNQFNNIDNLDKPLISVNGLTLNLKLNKGKIVYNENVYSKILKVVSVTYTWRYKTPVYKYIYGSNYKCFIEQIDIDRYSIKYDGEDYKYSAICNLGPNNHIHIDNIDARYIRIKDYNSDCIFEYTIHSDHFKTSVVPITIEKVSNIRSSNTSIEYIYKYDNNTCLEHRVKNMMKSYTRQHVKYMSKYINKY